MSLAFSAESKLVALSICFFNLQPFEDKQNLSSKYYFRGHLLYYIWEWINKLLLCISKDKKICFSLLDKFFWEMPTICTRGHCLENTQQYSIRDLEEALWWLNMIRSDYGLLLRKTSATISSANWFNPLLSWSLVQFCNLCYMDWVLIMVQYHLVVKAIRWFTHALI